MNDDTKAGLVAIGLILAFAALIVFLMTYRSETNAQVVQLRWSRAIDIQRYQTVQESDWSVPDGGRETRSYLAYHHSVTYISGYISSEMCSGKPVVCTTVRTPIYSSYPVYQTKYDYDIDRWITVRTPERHGVGTAAVWPDVSDLKEGTALGSERAATRYSKYTVAFTDNYSLDMTEERWRAFQPGQKVTLVLNIFKQALDVRA